MGQRLSRTIVFVFCPHFWRWPPLGLCAECTYVYELVRLVKMTAGLSDDQIHAAMDDLTGIIENQSEERPEE